MLYHCFSLVIIANSLNTETAVKLEALMLSNLRETHDESISDHSIITKTFSFMVDFNLQGIRGFKLFDVDNI